MPDGSVFRFENEKNSTYSDKASPKETSKSISTVSNNNIPQTAEKSQEDLSLVDTDGNELSEQQQAYFADSKVRDKKGKLQIIYHGTDADFFTFDTKVSGGSHGNAEGFGIYLTDDPEVSSKYGERQIKGYANITRPAYGFKKTITPTELAKLIQATCEKEAAWMVELGDYDNVKDALRDTWVSNYVMTYDYASMRDVYADVAKQIGKLNGNDADIVYEVMNGQGIRDYTAAMEFYNDVLTPTTGIDGIWQIWTNEETGQKSNIYLAFNSNQIKETTNTAPTEDKDIRYSLVEDAEAAELEERLRYSDERTGEALDILSNIVENNLGTADKRLTDTAYRKLADKYLLTREGRNDTLTNAQTNEFAKRLERIDSMMTTAAAS